MLLNCVKLYNDDKKDLPWIVTSDRKNQGESQVSVFRVRRDILSRNNLGHCTRKIYVILAARGIER